MGRAVSLALCGLLVASLVGCATKEVLLSKSAVVPAGVDLSGQWQLQRDSRGSNQRLAEASSGEPVDILAEAKRMRTGRGSRAAGVTAVYVFLEVGENLKVTQTSHGLFVSFDRAVVEEYRFGENTVVSVGPIAAARVSGWEDGAYVIETLDEDGAKLVERYRLDDQGATLVRSVTLFDRGQRVMTEELQYDRAT